jgi:hypothetical protein
MPITSPAAPTLSSRPRRHIRAGVERLAGLEPGSPQPIRFRLDGRGTKWVLRPQPLSATAAP